MTGMYNYTLQGAQLPTRRCVVGRSAGEAVTPNSRLLLFTPSYSLAVMPTREHTSLTLHTNAHAAAQSLQMSCTSYDHRPYPT